MQNKLDKNQPETQKTEQDNEVKVETVVIEAYEPFGSSNMPTNREEIRRQLGFKR